MRNAPLFRLALAPLLLATACDAPADPAGLDDGKELAVATAASPASVDTESFFVSAGGRFYNVCTDEFVGFGEGAGFRIVVRAAENDEGIHLGFHENGVRLHGPGLENDGGFPGAPTDTRYHGMLVIDETWNARAPSYPESYTFVMRVMVHASGDLPTRVQYRRYHVTVDAEGEIAVEVEEPFRTACRG